MMQNTPLTTLLCALKSGAYVKCDKRLVKHRHSLGHSFSIEGVMGLLNGATHKQRVMHYNGQSYQQNFPSYLISLWGYPEITVSRLNLGIDGNRNKPHQDWFNKHSEILSSLQTLSQKHKQRDLTVIPWHEFNDAWTGSFASLAYFTEIMFED